MRNKDELEGLQLGELEVLKCLTVTISDNDEENGYTVLLVDGSQRFLLAKDVEKAIEGDGNIVDSKSDVKRPSGNQPVIDNEDSE